MTAQKVCEALLRIDNLVVGALALDNREAIALPHFWVCWKPFFTIDGDSHHPEGREAGSGTAM